MLSWFTLMLCAQRCTVSHSISKQEAVQTHRSRSTHRASASVDGLTLLVGEGFARQKMRRAVDAGAHWVVTGTITEDASSMDELRERLLGLVQACSV